MRHGVPLIMLLNESLNLGNQQFIANLPLITGGSANQILIMKSWIIPMIHKVLEKVFNK
jgi:hypothetical protein